ncbi:MAG: nicotinamide mononucleotide transporter [Bacteroidaceae bacterium]|nr:nicotinamide mononucleotide transporter [Bacteroidaceae bacterium]
MEHTLEIIGTFVGLVYLWLEYKASIWLWIASIIMPAIYIFVYYEAGLYADFGINIYYLGAAVYGWFIWKYGNKSKEQKELPITCIPNKSWLKSLIVFIVTLIIIAWLLINYTDSNVPWWDAFTTALSIIGMWMLARKYLEQWWVWFVVDVISVGLYIYKELYFTAGLYGLYATIAIFGWLNWKKLMKTQEI